MHSIYSHPDNEGIFYLLTRVDGGFIVYELDVLHNQCEHLCKYSGDVIQRILISEDCKTVFLILSAHGNTSKNHLFAAPLGKSASFAAPDYYDDGSPRVEIVHSFKTVSSSLIIIYEELGITKVGILNDGEYRSYEDKFKIADNAQDYSLLNSGNILMLKSVSDYSFECIIIKKSSK